MLKVRSRGWVVLAAALGAGCARASEVEGPGSPGGGEPPAGAVAEQRNVAPAPAAPPTVVLGRPSEQLAGLLRFLDTRPSSIKPRASQLVLTELNGVERLLELTAPGAPDRPQLVRRVAEDYVELRNATTREEPSLSGEQAVLAGNRITAASVQAIAHYEKLLDIAPSYGKRDDVLYYLAIEHGFRSDLRQVREKMFELIKDHPISTHVPLAYFAFGELFRFEALTERSKTQLALAAFKEVARYPQQQNRAYCLSLERMAWLSAPGAPKPALGYDEAAACTGYLSSANAAGSTNDAQSVDAEVETGGANVYGR